MTVWVLLIKSVHTRIHAESFVIWQIIIVPKIKQLSKQKQLTKKKTFAIIVVALFQFILPQDLTLAQTYPLYQSTWHLEYQNTQYMLQSRACIQSDKVSQSQQWVFTSVSARDNGARGRIFLTKSENEDEKFDLCWCKQLHKLTSRNIT